MEHSRHMSGPTFGKHNKQSKYLLRCPRLTQPNGRRAASTWGCNQGSGPNLTQTQGSISVISLLFIHSKLRRAINLTSLKSNTFNLTCCLVLPPEVIFSLHSACLRVIIVHCFHLTTYFSKTGCKLACSAISNLDLPAWLQTCLLGCKLACLAISNLDRLSRQVCNPFVKCWRSWLSVALPKCRSRHSSWVSNHT